MQACTQYPGFRLMVLALMAWAVVWGTSPSAGAQEDPSRSPEVSLVWQGAQYLCSPVEPEGAEGTQYLCLPVEPESAEGELHLCLSVEPESAEVVGLMKDTSKKCTAGACSADCGGGKGCICIAWGDTHDDCRCICAGGETSGEVKLEAAMVVDMSMDSLPLFEAASFLDALATEKILVPEGRRNEPVSLDLQHIPFDEVVYQLGLKIQ